MNFSAPEVCVRDTKTSRGRGVFARRGFSIGETVELCPVLVFTRSDRLPLAIKLRFFRWSELTGIPNTSALALGYGSVYNGANPANLRYSAVSGMELMQFVAARDISNGEELTINYSGEKGAYSSEGNRWFEENNIPFLES
jgi:hypothetical protein